MKLPSLPIRSYSPPKAYFKTSGVCSVCTTAFLCLLLPVLVQAQIYVAVNGNDANEGTKEKPLATVHAALRKVRELRRLNDGAIKNGATIFIGGGTYRFAEPLFVRPEDAGTTQSRTTIEALPQEKPVFSGGTPVGGWKKLTTAVAGLSKNIQGNVWVAEAPLSGDEVLNFRQLWVNGEKAVRARDKNGDRMDRILGWDKKTESCFIPKPAQKLLNVEGMEMVIHQWWAVADLRVKSVEERGDSLLLRFQQPESRIQSEHPWPPPWLSKETGNSAFYLTNALSFLDAPGEWFLDKKARKIYYWPRAGEDLRTAAVVAPVLETLVKMEGTAERPVANVTFRGIAFQHTTWLRPSQQGHVPLQAGMYLLDAYKLRPPGTTEKVSLENQAWVGRPAAAVQAEWANAVEFINCRFEHTASTALDIGRGVKDGRIEGNLFKDIGGTALLAGIFSDEATEAHLPYKPADEREVTERLNINNNLITDAAAEDWGCVGIGAGFVRNSVIHHNDLSDLPYTAISLGWGWTKAESVMRNNLVSGNNIARYGRQLYDVAAIYTLSAQPGTTVAGNCIDSIYKAPYAHIPSHWFYLYTDEGSSGITLKNNWTPSQKFLQNANGPGNVWEANGPTVADIVKQRAGLQPEYRYLLKEKAPYNKAFPVNREQPVIVEIVESGNASDDTRKLKGILGAAGADSNAVYRWQNHTVFFGKVQDAFVLKGKIQAGFSGATVNVYYNPFYEFNRQHCGDTATAREWDHVLLTANLVSNKALQQEYMAYHATQFEQWPEVAAGFCKALFQQLLVYRNGRQLMLVISIPKGENLDKLNPKTTEGNPRMVEWNGRMAKYQEGIGGTKPGETWVFFEKLGTQN